jgi:hypothetical protein
MSWWTVLKYFVLGVFCSAEWVSERYRTHSMRALARKFGLTFLGKKALPGALSLYGTPFAYIPSAPVANLIDGTCNGVRLIVFDCEVWEGKSSWARTVVAARAPECVFAAAHSNPEFRVDRSAAWSILYQPKGLSEHPNELMPIPDLEAQLEAIHQQPKSA